MSVPWIIFFALCIAINTANGQRVAVAYLSAGTIRGSVFFTETEQGVRVTGNITGMPPGLYGFHVHELGDTIDCLNTGAHFDPVGMNHGGPDHAVRHVGDLGNVNFISNGEGTISILNIEDSLIALRGVNNILGRGLVLHEQEDDLGLGGHETSLTTGNAGPRVACAPIGMHAPLEAWNSSSKVGPSIIIMTIATAATFLKISSY